MAHRDLEKQFHSFLIKNPDTKPIHLVKSEARLYAPYYLFERNFRDDFSDSVEKKEKAGSVIGKIDIVFKYRQTLYAGEIKYFDSRNDFWAAMKVVAYTTYFNWQNETLGSFDICHPAILIPKGSIRLEHQLICNKLRIVLFSIIRNGDRFVLDHVNP